MPEHVSNQPLIEIAIEAKMRADQEKLGAAVAPPNVSGDDPSPFGPAIGMRA